MVDVYFLQLIQINFGQYTILIYFKMNDHSYDITVSIRSEKPFKTFA